MIIENDLKSDRFDGGFICTTKMCKETAHAYLNKKRGLYFKFCIPVEINSKLLFYAINDILINGLDSSGTGLF